MIRVVLIAEEAAGGRVLRLLDNTPSVSIEAVLAAPGTRGQMGSVWTAAERAGCRLIPAERVKRPELAEEMREKDIDLVLNVHSLYLVHPALLEVPRLGAYNLHPGPLPEMAGLNVPSWAILLGKEEHGVTLHRMAAGIDDGAIAYEDRFPMPEGATGLSLSIECVRRGVPLVERLLEAVEQGDPIPERAQDLSLREYFDRQPPEGGSIDLARPAAHVAAHVRAADYRPFKSPWGHPRVMSEAGEVAICSATVADSVEWDGAPPGTVRLNGSGARVGCGDGWIAVEKVIVDGEARAADSVLRDGEILASLDASAEAAGAAQEGGVSTV